MNVVITWIPVQILTKNVQIVNNSDQLMPTGECLVHHKTATVPLDQELSHIVKPRLHNATFVELHWWILSRQVGQQKFSFFVQNFKTQRAFSNFKAPIQRIFVETSRATKIEPCGRPFNIVDHCSPML